MNKTASLLFFVVMVLVVLGLFMVLNTTSAEIIDHTDQNLYKAFIKQTAFALLGFVIALYVYKCDHRKLIEYSPYFFWFVTLCLALVLIPGVGQRINGARRWIGAFGISIQPSEFMKILLPMYYINLIQKDDKPLVLKRFLVILFSLAIPVGLILFEPDNGTAAILLLTLLALFYLTRVRWVFWGLPILFIFSVALTFASKMKHVADRIQVYLNPEMDLLGKGHQPYQAKIAAGSGKLFGKGLGESLQKFNYLPEARSDYIAAIFGEEFGFLGIFVVISLFFLFTYLGMKIASRAVDKKGFYLAAIMTFLIAVQAFLNLGVVSNLLPSKGTNLPFFSQGGSSLLANFLSLALIFNVAKVSDQQKTLKPIR